MASTTSESGRLPRKGKYVYPYSVLFPSHSHKETRGYAERSASPSLCIRGMKHVHEGLYHVVFRSSLRVEYFKLMRTRDNN